jgi:hypothetical protein
MLQRRWGVTVVRGFGLMLVVLGLVVGSGQLHGRSASAIDVAYLAPGDAVRVSDGPVNFRDDPVYSDGYAWVKVFDYGYGIGWMAAAFLAFDPNGYPSDGQ